MPRKNSKGYCDERKIDVWELNLCDYFQDKRKNSKPCCRNCAWFHITEPCKNKKDCISNDDS